MTFKTYPIRFEAYAMLLRSYLLQIFSYKKLLRVLYFAVLPALAFYILSLAAMMASGFSAMQVLRDPAQQMEVSGFLGFLSNLGIWLWVSAAAIGFFAMRTGYFAEKTKHRELLGLTVILSLMLASDDLFMIHDFYIRQRYCFLTYALFTAFMVFRHHKLIIKIEPVAFILMVLFFGLSIFIDIIQLLLPMPYEYTQVLEEGFKFTGMASWLYFIFRLAAWKSGKPDESAGKLSSP
jgi:hypothetical protein